MKELKIFSIGGLEIARCLVNVTGGDFELTFEEPRFCHLTKVTLADLVPEEGESFREKAEHIINRG